MTDEIVRTHVRVCVRRGSAIAVCEDPPLLELGASEVDVIEAIRLGLRRAYGDRRLMLLSIEVREGASARRHSELLR